MRAKPGEPPDRQALTQRCRSTIARAARGIACMAPIALTACQLDVLDPRGVIGIAEKTILIDSVAIMLAIVVPTIAATFAFAWWFRASNTRATYMPGFTYSGRIELIVWSIPLLTIILLGGVAWIGSHDLDPAKPLESSTPPLEVQVVSLDWKWLFIYPDQDVASVNQLVVPAGAPIHFALTSASVMNAFFVPQLGSMIYTMNGMDDAAEPARGHGRARSAGCPATSAAMASRTCTSRFARAAGRSSPPGSRAHKDAVQRSIRRAMALSQAKPGVAPFTYRPSLPGCSEQIITLAAAARAGTAGRAADSQRILEGRSMNLLGKLSWAAIPLDQPIPMIASAPWWRGHPGGAGLGR
jgi:cytochrome o ubiquinol oxidase subunit 2